ncbi:predicted protein [Nematostella vectensis]|uniref:SRCR domain-containing protein n=1 Tax=Nematostella vectensis TaxID=45351 RepID=A7RS23_NEMVE|nr:predicted protein [Nematostella vectensis]|eukprot:XP_001637792.1 predicted protein [Nematostella vectensis]
MAWLLLLLLLKVLLIQGVVLLSCEFNKDFCGWQHPVNTTDKWILTSEQHGNYTACIHEGRIYEQGPSRDVPMQLIYPNFTGHGDLVLSYYLFRYSYDKNELKVAVGNATLLSVFDWEVNSLSSWSSSRLRVDADREKVIIEGILHNNAVSGIVIDSIQFYEKNAKIKLTGGYTHMDGDVEIQVDGRWGKICIGASRIQKELVAMVTCRYLGYEGDGYLITSQWQRLPHAAWMDLRSCDGTEASVTECSGTFGRYVCHHRSTLAVNCRKAPCPGNCSCSGEAVESIRCRKQDILPQEPILIPYYISNVYMHGVAFSVFKKIIENPANSKKRLRIRVLEFSDAGITRISKGTFTSLYELKYLYLPWNRVKSLSSLEDGVFWEKGYGLELNLGYNAITNVTAADMKGKEMLFSLQLNDNRISYIEGGAFNACIELRSFDLRSNRLEEITYDVFGRFRDTIRMNFYNNTISKIEPRALDFGYTELDLRVNNLTDVSSVHPSPYSTLMKLLLGQNKITKFSPDILVGSRSLNFLDISDISLGRITVDLLKDLKQLVLLNAVRANIHHIDDFAFGGAKRISYM